MEQNLPPLPFAAGVGHHRGQAAENHHTPDGGSTGHQRGLEGAGSIGVGRRDEQYQKRGS